MSYARTNKKVKCCFVSSLILSIFGAMVFILAVLFMSAIFPGILSGKLKQKLPIRNGSETFKNWQNSSVPIYMKFYMFNLTNPQEVLNGEKPKIVEIGPYSYLEKRQKLNLSFEDNDETLSFQELKYFYFDSETSLGDPYKDQITTLNPLIITLIANIQNHDWIEKIFEFFHFESLFQTKSVNDTLWGYTDPFLEDICQITGQMCDKVIMGLMVGNNATISKVARINTGTLDLDQIGHIVNYDGKENLTIWTSDTANAINGSDGTMFKPLLTSADNVYVFSSDVCRSFAFEFRQKVYAKNDQRVHLLQFVGTKAQAQNASINPWNHGFCPAKPVGPLCPPGGLMDLSPCRSKGKLLVPLFASQPHFFLAEPWVSEPYLGIRPGTEQDSTQLNIEPHLGVPLEAYKRLQMNFYFRPQKRLHKYFGNMPVHDYFFPLFWLEEGATAPKELLDKLYSQLIRVTDTAKYISYAGELIGSVLFIMGLLICVLIVYKDRKMQHKKSNKNEPASSESDNSHQPMLDQPDNIHV